MQNQTSQRAAVRARLPADHSAEPPAGGSAGGGDGRLGRASSPPAETSKRRTAASASSCRPARSRNRTDSGRPQPHDDARRAAGTAPSASAQRQPSSRGRYDEVADQRGQRPAHRPERLEEHDDPAADAGRRVLADQRRRDRQLGAEPEADQEAAARAAAPDRPTSGGTRRWPARR